MDNFAAGAQINDTEIRPFGIDVPQADLDDLRDRLARTRWPDELTGPAGTTAFRSDNVRELAGYWRAGYDWRAHEAQLNEFPQFTTTIDGQNMHFLHVRSAEPRRPAADHHARLARLGGRVPGRHRPADRPGRHGGDPADAFHLVIPSNPGLRVLRPDARAGLEREPDGPGLGRADGAAWAIRGTGRRAATGARAISRELGVAHPEHVIGVHMNMLTYRNPDDPAS